MLLSQPKPGSLPPASHPGQSLLQQDLSGLPTSRGLLGAGVAGPSLAILHLGIRRAA